MHNNGTAKHDIQCIQIYLAKSDLYKSPDIDGYTHIDKMILSKVNVIQEITDL